MRVIIYLLLFLFFVQFGYFNQSFVEVSLFPFIGTYEMPLIVFAFCVFLITLLVSWAIFYFSLRKLKKQLKKLT